MDIMAGEADIMVGVDMEVITGAGDMGENKGTYQRFWM